MRLLRSLEQRFGRYAIPNLTMLLVLGQGLAFVLSIVHPPFMSQIQFTPAQFLAGEYWRIFTFAFTPPATHPIWILIALNCFWFIGHALEQTLGTFRYNLYLLVGYVTTVAVAFAHPGVIATNMFIGEGIFLAFAWLYPRFEFRLYFVLPIQVRWLALLAWMHMIYMLINGPMPLKLVVLCGISNFLLFFSADVLRWMRSGSRRVKGQVRATVASRPSVTHRCHVCGVSDRDNPDMEFRYCSQCADTSCYCRDHIHAHEHVR